MTGARTWGSIAALLNVQRAEGEETLVPSRRLHAAAVQGDRLGLGHAQVRQGEQVAKVWLMSQGEAARPYEAPLRTYENSHSPCIRISSAAHVFEEICVSQRTLTPTLLHGGRLACTHCVQRCDFIFHSPRLTVLPSSYEVASSQFDGSYRRALRTMKTLDPLARRGHVHCVVYGLLLPSALANIRLAAVVDLWAHNGGRHKLAATAHHGDISAERFLQSSIVLLGSAFLLFFFSVPPCIL